MEVLTSEDMSVSLIFKLPSHGSGWNIRQITSKQAISLLSFQSLLHPTFIKFEEYFTAVKTFALSNTEDYVYAKYIYIS